jgi:1-acyl-sn-glycerol-3-phosphate acyltransferase
MIVWYLLRVFAHVFKGLATCAFIFPFLDRDGRERRIKLWSARLLNVCRVRVATSQDQHAAGAGMFVSNHVSWLDIFVLNSLHPCRFVAKSEIRDWPFLGWLAEQGGTIFIARGRQRDVRKIYAGLVMSVRRGERVAFFPEGTTAPQGTVLPFHANLFEAAIEANAPVHPCAIRYLDQHGNLNRAADFIDEMSFAQSLLLVLRAGNMLAEITYLPRILPEASRRRELAAAAQASIGAALACCEEISRDAELADNPPETPHDLPDAPR